MSWLSAGCELQGTTLAQTYKIVGGRTLQSHHFWWGCPSLKEAVVFCTGRICSRDTNFKCLNFINSTLAALIQHHHKSVKNNPNCSLLSYSRRNVTGERRNLKMDAPLCLYCGTYLRQVLKIQLPSSFSQKTTGKATTMPASTAPL